METWLGRAEYYWTTTSSQNEPNQHMLTPAYTSFIPSECVKYILNREPVLYLANFSFFSERISCFTGSSNTDMARQDTFK